MRLRYAWIGPLMAVCACGSPTSPASPPPAVPTTSAAPVIRTIAVPSARVEAGQDVAISAVVEDADTDIANLTYQWAASAGTIASHGATAVWRMPEGIKSGVNVTITLTVIDTYYEVVNNEIVRRQFTVVGSSSPFRVHDSAAEAKELARRFLIDLFGNSAVQPEDCMVDFTEGCAGLPEGKTAELAQIRKHRLSFIVYQATMLAQRVDWVRSDFGVVHNAVLYNDQEIGKPPKSPTCGDFYVTVVYVGDRWWICESYFDSTNRSSCPASIDNEGVGRVLRAPGGVK